MLARLRDRILGRAAARRAAIAEGLGVTSVYREFEFTKDRGRSFAMSRVKCVEYRLRHDAATDLHWRILLRHGASDLGDGRKLEVKGGPLPDTLRLALQDLADDTSVEMGWELFEFEGDDKGVSVFWVEFGGAKMVQRLVQHLRRLSRAMHKA